MLSRPESKLFLYSTSSNWLCCHSCRTGGPCPLGSVLWPGWLVWLVESRLGNGSQRHFPLAGLAGDPCGCKFCEASLGRPPCEMPGKVGPSSTFCSSPGQGPISLTRSLFRYTKPFGALDLFPEGLRMRLRMRFKGEHLKSQYPAVSEAVL